MELQVKTLAGESAGTVTVSDEVFGLEPRADILHRMVRYQELKRQQGTHKTNGRSEVKATSKKMYKQKGTGSARHGNKAAPQFRGGGRAFGPVVRSHAIDLPKKVRALALKHALSAKAKDGGIVVLDKASLDDPKTKALKARFPEKTLVPLSGAAICGNMKVNTLAKLAWCLDHQQHELTLDEDVRVRAERSLRRMLDLSGGWTAPTPEQAALEEASIRTPGGCGCA